MGGGGGGGGGGGMGSAVVDVTSAKGDTDESCNDGCGGNAVEACTCVEGIGVGTERDMGNFCSCDGCDCCVWRVLSWKRSETV